MHRCHRSQREQRRTETKWRSPCAGSIYHLSHHSKKDTPKLRARQTRSVKRKSQKFSLSCDDPKPFHFPVEPDAINDQCNCSGKRRCRACKTNRRPFNEIDPDAPGAGPDRKQRRENDENDMESSKRHLAKDRVVVPRQ